MFEKLPPIYKRRKGFTLGETLITLAIKDHCVTQNFSPIALIYE